MPWLLSFCLFLSAPLLWADSEEMRVAILGDDMTYDGRWVVQIEAAIRSQKGLARCSIVNFALPSETVSGLSESGHAGGSYPRPSLLKRLKRILDQYHPTHVIIFYGINDGIYLSFDEGRFNAYREGMNKVRVQCLRAAARPIFLTPPLFEPDRPKPINNYHLVMKAYAEWLVKQRKLGWEVIDVYTKLLSGVQRLKRENPQYIYARDGVHPGDEGHQLIAQAVWDDLAPKMQWRPELPPLDNAKAKPLTLSMQALRNAWLTQIGYEGPSLVAGMPLPEAEARSAALLTEFLRSL